MKRAEHGFTLTEILIVVVILGIMASVAIPRFFPQAEKGRVSEAIAILGAIRQGEEAYSLEFGTYCACTNAACNAAGNCIGAWGGLGMASPDAAPDPSRFFNFSVIAPTATTFLATATRTADSARGAPPDGYQGTTITTNQNGTSGGNHPFRPI